jgi:putative hydrolase
MPPSNLDIAELLARRGEDAEGHRAKAYRRAAAAALTWAEEAVAVRAEGRSLEELEGLGPSLSRRVATWLDEAPEPPEPPAPRDGFSSFSQARRVVAEHPGWVEALRGDFQMHTHLSDGKTSVREMAAAAAALGYEHVAITDHSKGLRIPRGIDEEVLAEQGRGIEELNSELEQEGLDFRVLSSLEMNLDLEGRGDMEPDSLGALDLVIGSFHTALRGEQDQTDRYLAALSNPHVNVIGHPTCRRFDRRPGIKADWDRIVDAAAVSGKALEINAHPHRQDLPVELVEKGEAAGVTFSFGTDAHDPSELRFMATGVATAIRAGVARERIINYWPRSKLLDWAAR